MDTGQNTNLQFIEGVNVSSFAQKKFSDFEKNYLAVREIEKRILTPEEIKRLPYPRSDSPDSNLWEIRRKNIKRFLNYLADQKPQRILDIGCGNGFFTNMLAAQGHKVVGVDVNFTELKQAAFVFHDQKINWYYLDILHEPLPEERFEIITFNASFHYFNDQEMLLSKCFTLLKPGGEIHILDSPFYKENEREEAQKRSHAYFKSLNVETMSNHYFHITYSFLKGYNFDFKYKPSHFLNKLFRIKDSPFPWLVIRQ